MRIGIGDIIVVTPGDPGAGPGDPGVGDDAPLISADGFKVLYNGSYVSIKDICRIYDGCSYENANGFEDDEGNTLVGTPYNSLDPWNTNIRLPYYQGGQQLRWILKDSKPNFNDSPVSLPTTHCRIYISNNILKIDLQLASGPWVAVESYSASDFIDGVVPKRILVALQAGGGSGGNGNWNTAGSGGGGGAGWIGILNIESKVYISIGAGGEVGDGIDDNDGNPGGNSYINDVSEARALTLGGGGAGKYDGWNSNSAGGTVTLNAQYEGFLYWTLLSVNGGYGGHAGDNAVGNQVDAAVGGGILSRTIYSTNVNNDKTSANQKILNTHFGGRTDSSNLKKSGGGGGASLFGPGGNSFVDPNFGDAEPGLRGAGGGGARDYPGQPKGGEGGWGICYLYLPLK